MTGPMLGVIADDLTGACDLADAVRDAGGRAVVMLGVPAADLRLPPCGCAVVALRTRTAPAEVAVEESVAAARRLLAAGATTLYQKYCSTFDSTDDGTIGLVADALRTLLGGAPAPSVGTPATPRAGRTQYQGHLFVGDRLLSESPLRHHPLTPMHDPDLVRVLGRQTPAPVALLPWTALHSADPARALADTLDGGAAHVLADALTDDDLDRLARSLPTDRPVLLGGGAGFAAALARQWDRTGPADLGPGGSTDPDGSRSLIISGSCSARTREQIARFDGPRLELDPLALAADPDTVDQVVDRLADAYRDGLGPVLVSSSADPGAVRATQDRLGRDRAARVLERAAARVATRAVHDLGVRRLLIAGGETSGAVVGALGLGVLRVGPAAAPGVPWMVPVDGPPLRLLLKSGNFGDPDLFRTAWEVCP